MKTYVFMKKSNKFLFFNLFFGQKKERKTAGEKKQPDRQQSLTESEIRSVEGRKKLRISGAVFSSLLFSPIPKPLSSFSTTSSFSLSFRLNLTDEAPEFYLGSPPTHIAHRRLCQLKRRRFELGKQGVADSG